MHACVSAVPEQRCTGGVTWDRSKWGRSRDEGTGGILWKDAVCLGWEKSELQMLIHEYLGSLLVGFESNFKSQENGSGPSC